MHIPLADSPPDGIRRDSKTTVPLTVPGVKKEWQADVPGAEILKTTTVDVERDFAAW